MQQTNQKISSQVLKELVEETKDLDYGKIELIFQNGKVIDLIKKKRKRLS